MFTRLLPVTAAATLALVLSGCVIVINPDPMQHMRMMMDRHMGPGGEHGGPDQGGGAMGHMDHDGAKQPEPPKTEHVHPEQRE